MKIALLSPSGAMHRYNGSFKRVLHYAPLTLTTLAAMVPLELEAEVVIYDESSCRIPPDLTADLIGITAITGTAPRAYRWADHFRRRGCRVVLGGPHVTLLPKEAAAHADAVVTGYAEQTWPRLLRDFAAGRLQGRYDMDLESLTLAGRPPPRRRLLPRTGYVTHNTVEAVRGCNHVCSFCVIPSIYAPKRVLTRPVREIITEIEQLPGRRVVFTDVNLMANRDFLLELLREMVPLRRHWYGLVTSEIGEDRELFDLIVASGCRGLLIGFESFTSSSLRDIYKSFNIKTDYALLLDRLHDHGIAVNGTFVLGTDEDGPDVFERTVEAVERLRIDLPRFAVLTPFPGTPLFQELDEAGRILTRDWSLYDVEHCVFRPRRMTPEQLEEGLDWTWRQTYTPEAIRRRIAGFNSRLPSNLALNLGYRAYAGRLGDFSATVMSDNSDIPS